MILLKSYHFVMEKTFQTSNDAMKKFLPLGKPKDSSKVSRYIQSRSDSPG